MIPAIDPLCVDQIIIHHLHCPFSDVVHSLYPQHLILGLEFLGDALHGRPFVLPTQRTYYYPEYDDTQITAKVPSQELSDAMVKAFKKKLKD